MLQVQWIKSTNNTWLPFETFNIANVTGYGVYFIWHAGNPARTVYVGQGDIKARLTAHRQNADIAQYAAKGTLYVTWATVPAAQRDGVERYLADYYQPLVGEKHPDVRPIQVNLAA